MKILFFALLGNLKRIAISPSILIAAVGLAAINYLSVYQEISILNAEEVSVLYLYEIGTYSSFWILFLLFAAIPGATLFCADWENRFVRFWISRSTKTTYGTVTALSCFLSAVLTVIVGEWIFIFVLQFAFPMLLDGNILGLGFLNTVYNELMNNQSILIYFAIKILIKAFCAGFCAIVALWISTKITNVFVALASPIIIYYLVENLLIMLQMPRVFQISALAKGHVMMGNTLGVTLLYPVLLFTGLAIIFGVLFTLSAKRRIENG